MGLDMYLTRKVYVGGNYDFNQVKGTIDISREGKQLDIPLNKIRYIDLAQAYWRKANAIHKWFIDNCAGGVDDCRPMWVSYDKLVELRNLCEKVKANHELAPELLPTQSGFFFGDTNYNEWYFEDIDLTIEQLSDINEEDEYEYEASW